MFIIKIFSELFATGTLYLSSLFPHPLSLTYIYVAMHYFAASET